MIDKIATCERLLDCLGAVPITREPQSARSLFQRDER
jgi:hypothetical protein